MRRGAHRSSSPVRSFGRHHRRRHHYYRPHHYRPWWGYTPDVVYESSYVTVPDYVTCENIGGVWYPDANVPGCYIPSYLL